MYLKSICLKSSYYSVLYTGHWEKDFICKKVSSILKIKFVTTDSNTHSSHRFTDGETEIREVICLMCRAN